MHIGTFPISLQIVMKQMASAKARYWREINDVKDGQAGSISSTDLSDS